MPIVIPLSVKLAITAGAVIGGTVAAINNREKLWEFGEQCFQQGADYCREKLHQHKTAMMYASDMDTLVDNDGDNDKNLSISDDDEVTELESTIDSDRDLDSDDDITTPEITDNEYEYELHHRNAMWRDDLELASVD